ncbi:MAG: DUF885 domain-containing protein [Bacteroidota bacterium]
MKYLFLVAVVFSTFYSCTAPANKIVTSPEKNTSFNSFLDNYYESRLQLFPLEATFIGDNRFNDKLYIDISENERERQKTFFRTTLDSLSAFNYDSLNDNDKLSYDVLHRDLSLSLEGFRFHDNYLPINQFSSLPLIIGQMAGGKSAQPFVTIKDYDNWLARLSIFSNWLDSSIIYFRKGIDSGIVLPKSIAIKFIPQIESMIVDDVESSLFFSPLKTFPASFGHTDKLRITAAYKKSIAEKVTPAYKRLYTFLKNEYLPKARSSSGVGALPGGQEYYKYQVRLSTTTNKSPEEIYSVGIQEVERIKQEMELTKERVGYKGDLKSFLEYLKNDKRFMPFSKPGEILNAFHNIRGKIQPNLLRLFSDTPKTKFEIRQTEAFRAASASAEYSQGTPDGQRPGIFYIPILDPASFNITSGMESLFLHEAIPGHHYQISLQQENMQLPKFRRFGGNNAYVEGWALYCESLGKELGLYTDPYQYMGALGDEMHRAVRLVVDVAIHSKNMTREDAIRYMMNNQSISEAGATSEIERYMVWPAQALGYKIGALKISEIRMKIEKQLGSKFNIAEFHKQVLKDGALPLDVLEKKLATWAATVK